MAQDTATQAYTIDSILERLEHHRQRATYGAVAKLVNRPPRNLMAGRNRDTRSSWIVSRETGLPTGYTDEQLDSRLTENETILSVPDDLSRWLDECR